MKSFEELNENDRTGDEGYIIQPVGITRDNRSGDTVACGVVRKITDDDLKDDRYDVHGSGEKFMRISTDEKDFSTGF